MRIIVHYNQSQADAQQLVYFLNEQRPDSATMVKGDLADIHATDQLVDDDKMLS